MTFLFKKQRTVSLSLYVLSSIYTCSIIITMHSFNLDLGPPRECKEDDRGV